MCQQLRIRQGASARDSTSSCLFEIAGLLVAGFKQIKGQRAALLDELMTTVVPNLPTAKRTLRSFIIGDASMSNIQMISALLLQLLQVRASETTHICSLLQILWRLEHATRRSSSI
jgi:hypothetical protein